MRHLHRLFLLSLPSLALFATGCGGGSGTVIGSTAQTITFNNPGTQTVGAPLTLSATANSNLAVSFASVTPSVCTVSGTTATFETAGGCTIEASAGGNSTYAPAAQVVQSFIVNPAIAPNTTIYIVGEVGPLEGPYVAEEWRLTSGSPTATATALPTPSGMTSALAGAVAVSGSDVYVGGTASNGTNQTAAVYWLNNGAATTLPMPSGTSDSSSSVGSIAVSGNNVYIAGAAWDGNNNNQNGNAVLWVNGAATILTPPSGMAFSAANAIAVSGSNVYVAGMAWNTDSDESAVLWVNGVATLLPLPSGLTGNYTANGVAVSGGNVYVVGNNMSNTNYSTNAISWVNNGAAATLTIPPYDNALYSSANAITASGGNVYVAGDISVSTDPLTTNTSQFAVYWPANGEATNLLLPSGMAISPVGAAASGIAFSGSDMYTVGYVSTNTGQIAAYWVNNGTATLLPAPNNNNTSWAWVNAITVATQ